jgi:hypothetical protein
MAKRGSIIINGGIFLSQKQKLRYDYWDIGYFECEVGFPDFRVYVDGEEKEITPAPKLGAHGAIVDIAVETGNKGIRAGVTTSSSFYKDVLQRQRLYDGDQLPVDEKQLDCILRLHSGALRPSMVKRRYFKQYHPTTPPANPTRKDMGAVAHNVIAYTDLNDGDKLTISNGTTSYLDLTIDGSVKESVEVEILADDSTALKYFCHCIDPTRPFYWVPNQGWPPGSVVP